MKRIPLILVALLMLASCGQKSVLDEQHTFANGVWNHFTPESYNVDITNTDNYYDINVNVAIDTTIYRYDNLPLTVNIYSPNGEHRMFYADIPFKHQGRWRGQVVDGQRTFNQRIRSYFSFNTKGTHRIDIAQATSQYDLEGVRMFGVQIVKAKLDYDKL